MWRRHPIFCGLAGLSLLLCAAAAVAWVLAGMNTAQQGHPQDRISAFVVESDLCASWPDPDAQWWSVPNTKQHKVLGVGVLIYEWDNGSQWWMVRVPMIHLLLLTAILPAVWLVCWMRLRAQLAKAGVCRQCGYDLRGSDGDCPECGAKRAA